jgi:transcription factor E2F4/5
MPICFFVIQEKQLSGSQYWVISLCGKYFLKYVFTSSAYVRHEDICRCFHGETMLTVQAPSGTQLEVPIPDGVSRTEFIANLVTSFCY